MGVDTRMSESRVHFFLDWCFVPLPQLFRVLFLWTKEKKQKTPSLPAISKLLFSVSFMDQGVLVSQ